MDDGRYSNNGWMQELPEPVTKMTWDNAVLISRKTARDLDVANGDMVEISLNGRTVTGPVWTQPGMADYTLGLALGYGRERAGRVGNGVGFNAHKIFSGKYIETGATMQKDRRDLHAGLYAASLEHGRPSGGARGELGGHFLKTQKDAEAKGELNHFIDEEFRGVEPPIIQSLYPNPLDEAKKTALHQWGMAIDLNACVGCGTCIVACQSENNIPIAGTPGAARPRNALAAN